MDDKYSEKIYRESNPLLSFKEIYFECNVKPLFEQVLREMAFYSVETFSSLFSRRIKNEILKTNHSLVDMKIIKAVLQYIKGNSHSVASPFAIKLKLL